MLHKARTGFTLVELLVVITIIGILMSLLLPAVQSIRQAARTLQCKNHLKQMGLAALNHENTQRHFPTGGWGWGWVGEPDRGFAETQPGGWVYVLLPMMEQQALFDLGKGLTGDALREQTTRRVQTPVPLLNCPSRRPPETFEHRGLTANFDRVDRVARTDYGINGGDVVAHPGNMGLWSSHCGNSDCGPSDPIDRETAREKASTARSFGATGINFPMSKIRVSAIRDGSSNTYLIGEKYLNPDSYENGYDLGDNENMYIGFNEDNARWAHFQPRQDRPGLASSKPFGSAHVAGFNMVMCDGSVHLINFSIELNTHRHLGNRRDGQVASLDNQ